MPSREAMIKLLRGDEPLNNLGNASSAPNTMAMRFGNAVSPFMRSAQSIFPASNPYGQGLLRFILGNAPTNSKKASDVLNKAGIPGIKYLDQGSRGAGEGTRNFVLFDDTIPKILKQE